MFKIRRRGQDERRFTMKEKKKYVDKIAEEMKEFVKGKSNSNYPDCVGKKIGSQGRGRGLGTGKGKGPIGRM